MTVVTETVFAHSLEALQPPVENWPHAPTDPIKGPMHVHSFVSPDCGFKKMDELLGRAKQSLMVHIYNVSSEDMLGLVRRAIDSGFQVRIMYDSTDTRQDEVRKLELLDVDLKVAPSNGPRRAFTVCHQKYVVVDDDLVILGGANWATTSIPNPGARRWKKGNREWLFAMESARAATQFKKLFDLDWNWEAPEVEELEALAMPREEEVVIAPLVRPPDDQIVDAAEFDLAADAWVIPLLSPQNYFEIVLERLQKAKVSVDVQQQYIKAPDESPYVAELLSVLKSQKSKLKTRIISSSIYRSGWDATKETLDRYKMLDKLRALNRSHFTHCHNKGVIIEGETVVVSSTNWSDNSIGARARRVCSSTARRSRRTTRRRSTSTGAPASPRPMSSPCLSRCRKPP